MAATETLYRHITLDSKGVPVIAGTTTKVIELVIERIAYGWSPEELHLQHQYLSLGQIFAALAYYEDHKAGLTKDVEQRLEKVEQLREKISSSLLVEKLKQRALANGH